MLHKAAQEIRECSTCYHSAPALGTRRGSRRLEPLCELKKAKRIIVINLESPPIVINDAERRGGHTSNPNEAIPHSRYELPRFKGQITSTVWG